jgi:hypothetical protein
MTNTSNYQFRVDYSNGLEIHCHDLINEDTKFYVKVFIHKTKIDSNLKWKYVASGGHYVTEEILNTEDFEFPFTYKTVSNHRFYHLHYRGFVPYKIEIYHDETKELLFTDNFDPRNKLVNFTLNSGDPITLHTWMCAIDKFKKENGCQISIINDYLKKNQKYSFVDSYWGFDEDFNRYYAGYKIGNYGNKSAPDFQLNPDGTQNKNDLEIIEDVLYYFTKML